MKATKVVDEENCYKVVSFIDFPHSGNTSTTKFSLVGAVTKVPLAGSESLVVRHIVLHRGIKGKILASMMLQTGTMGLSQEGIDNCVEALYDVASDVAPIDEPTARAYFREFILDWMFKL